MNKVRIAICGMGREQIARLVREHGGPEVEPVLMTDFEASVAVKSGQVDYYIGACQSGAGGALAVANAILGPALVLRLAGEGGRPPQFDQVKTAINDGKKAFGVVHTQIDTTIPLIVSAVLDRASAVS